MKHILIGEGIVRQARDLGNHGHLSRHALITSHSAAHVAPVGGLGPLYQVNQSHNGRTHPGFT